MNALLTVWLNFRALPNSGAILYVLVASTVILIAGFVLASLMRRASAAELHLLWLLVMAALAGSLASAFLPRVWVWHVPRSLSVLDNITRPERPLHPAAVLEPSPATVAAPVSVLPRLMARAPRLVESAGYLVVVWLGGSLLALIPLAAGAVHLRRLRRHTHLADGESRVLLREEQARMGVTGKVELLLSDELQVPLAWGVWRRKLAVPHRLLSDSHETIRAVLRHELAHFRRWDFAGNLFARCTVALFWFHPLAWLALRRLRMQRELACDDLVLSSGTEPAGYAESLIALARAAAAPATMLQLALPVVSASRLETRIRSILDDTRRRGAHSWRTWWLAFSVIIALALAGGVVLPAEPFLRPPPGSYGSTLSPEIQEHLRRLARAARDAADRMPTEFVASEILTEAHDKEGQWHTAVEPTVARSWVDRRRQTLQAWVERGPSICPTDQGTFTLQWPAPQFTSGDKIGAVWEAGEQFTLPRTGLYWTATGLLIGVVEGTGTSYRLEMVNDPRGQLFLVEWTYDLGTFSQRTRYWLDPKRGYAILRAELAFNGEVEYTSEVEELQEIEPGFWLPRKATQVTAEQRNHFLFTKVELNVELPW